MMMIMMMMMILTVMMMTAHPPTFCHLEAWRDADADENV